MKRFSLLILLASLALVHCNSGGADLGIDNASGSSDTEVQTDFKDTAVTGSNGNVAVDAGFASDGTIIAIPSGFTPDQCRFTAAIANVDGDAISVSASINTQTGQVVCKKVVQDRDTVPPEFVGCVASYTIICTK